MHATGWSRSLEVTAGGTGVVSPALRRLKGYGFPPAGAWCRNTRECLGMKLRPGNAGSNTFARPGGSAGGRPAAGPVPVPEQGPGPGRRGPDRRSRGACEGGLPGDVAGVRRRRPDGGLPGAGAHLRRGSARRSVTLADGGGVDAGLILPIPRPNSA
jgi:hypothetical protein